ncbi:MAG: MurR/RpiR family transcriptional regulator [Thermoanaerobaculales bacterium]|jgi:DNA-binding MurR/RpiR family transcriptional regulator|nr:MurR/RpiR family transcriptional regulator [Thermoanaerobaculales bacterium]
MGRKTRETGFRDLVAREGATMPRQQRSIADYVLEHLTTVPFLSVPELARRVGVSEATVVRFAQRLGYPGFSELKVELVELLQQQLRQGADGPAEDVVLDVLGAVAELEVANIRRTVDALDRRVVAEVAEAFFAADGVFSFGMGVSAHLAELAAYSLLQIGLRASCLSTRFSSPREQLVAVTPRDLVLVFSLPPYSRQALEVLDEARRIGVPAVAVTDRVTAPAARLARWVLPVKSDNMMFTNAIAAVTVLLNALATEVAAGHREQAVAALSRINRALAEDEDVLPPG